MESILNTVSKSQVRDISGITGQISINVNYEKSSEWLDDAIVELYPVSSDEVEILDAQKRKNGVMGMEGELLVNHSKDVMYAIDIDGTLNITDYNQDKYFIDENGYLMMNL